MSPVDSRKRSPRLWKAYDDAGHIAIDLKENNNVVAAVAAHVDPWGGTCQALPMQLTTARTVELLDLLRTLLRERIEAEASGKAVSR